MGRYQLGDQTWSIERDGTRLVITEPDGVAHTEQLPDPATTATRFAILTGQRLRAGWKLEKQVIEPVAVIPRAPHVYGARNPELEAAILEDPVAREPWLVYGDWLQQQNDPRGEMIAREAAESQDPQLRRRTDVYLEQHRDYFLNGLPVNDEFRSLWFQWSFIYGVAVQGERAAKLLKEVLTNDAARFVGRICVNSSKLETLARAIKRIGLYAPATLRSLSFPRDGWIHDLAPLREHLPRLHQFELRAKLAGCAEALLASHLPELRSLALLLDVGDLSFAQALPWFERFDKLTEIDLDFRTDRAAVDAIISSRIGPRLETLGLERIGIAAAQHIVKRLPDLPRLRQLRVWSPIHAVPREALTKAGVTVHVIERYVPVEP